MIIKCIVMCKDANGAPDIFRCEVDTTDANYKEGYHYDEAKDLAKEARYEDPMMVCDENDPAYKAFAPEINVEVDAKIYPVLHIGRGDISIGMRYSDTDKTHIGVTFKQIPNYYELEPNEPVPREVVKEIDKLGDSTLSMIVIHNPDSAMALIRVLLQVMDRFYPELPPVPSSDKS